MISVMSSMMLAIALALFPSPASAAERGDRAFTREMALEIQLPTPIEMSQTFGDLEYERAPFLGLLVDLNGDGVPEYLVRAAPARCSERGCPYAIFDGASFHSLGTIFGSVIYVRAARSETFAIINTFSPNGGDSATYTTYAYNHTRYVARESVQLSGDALRRLRDELAGAQSGR